MPLEIGSNNLKTPATVIDKIMDYLAVWRLTLERGHQSHLFCHQASVSISSRIILSVALEIPSRSKGAEREPGSLIGYQGNAGDADGIIGQEFGGTGGNTVTMARAFNQRSYKMWLILNMTVDSRCRD